VSAATDALAAHLSRALGERVEVAAMTPLAGGAVRRHFSVAARVAAEMQSFVLRTDGLTPLGIGLDLAQEFALLRQLAAAGVTVAPPVCCSDDPTVTGAPFHVTRRVEGTADPATLVASGPYPHLAERLGRELALVQLVRPPAFLGEPPGNAMAARLDWARGWLDRMGEARPAAEWAMRELGRLEIDRLPPVLCHGDFRTGNYLTESAAVGAVLDWELAGWGDPDEDIGWFCSRHWRFGSALEAGGIAHRADFYRGYAAVSGRRPDPARVRVWEALASLKWLIICLRQRDRFLRHGERSLDLALTGRRAADCEYELLRLTARMEEYARPT
jgi:aminoglycoside phosphotransferase (APT) family kinase protein